MKPQRLISRTKRSYAVQSIKRALGRSIALSKRRISQMDATIETVVRLYEQGLSLNQIEARHVCSKQKARKILITAGLYTTPLIKQIQKLYAEGKSIQEIAIELNLSGNAVSSMLPYSKGIYNAEYPSINAMKIRKSRNKATAKNESK
jgi:DNA-binding NarL/FixJ family response regulator